MNPVRNRERIVIKKNMKLTKQIINNKKDNSAQAYAFYF